MPDNLRATLRWPSKLANAPASFAYQVRWRVGASVKVMSLEVGTPEEYALAEAERVSSWFKTEAQVYTACGRVLATYSDGMRVDQ